MKLRELIERLNEIDPSKHVVFDFCGCVPTIVTDWEGDYSVPSLNWEPRGNTIRSNPVSVGDLLRQLTYYSNDTIYNPIVYVDNPGDYSGTFVRDVIEVKYNKVIIRTVNDKAL